MLCTYVLLLFAYLIILSLSNQEEVCDQEHYYRILGISQTSDKREIKKAYRRESMRLSIDAPYHLVESETLRENERRLRMAHEAYHALMNGLETEGSYFFCRKNRLDARQSPF
mmetsp:Transcript_28077/g.41772  ORF Transcript_28077/g.41772 Transcript_28077/m.41772 type:complete len:113 (-) Transcript_28077:1656-1994(-)